MEKVKFSEAIHQQIQAIKVRSYAFPKLYMMGKRKNIVEKIYRLEQIQGSGCAVMPSISGKTVAMALIALAKAGFTPCGILRVMNVGSSLKGHPDSYLIEDKLSGMKTFKGADLITVDASPYRAPEKPYHHAHRLSNPNRDSKAIKVLVKEEGK